MTAEKPGSHTCRGRRRRARAWAVFALVAVALMAISAAPAGATATSVTEAPPDVTLRAGGLGMRQSSGEGRGQPGQLNVAMLATAIGLGLAIGALIASRTRIDRERSIRRFKGQLRSADLVSLCQAQAPAHQDRSEHQDLPVEDPPAAAPEAGVV